MASKICIGCNLTFRVISAQDRATYSHHLKNCEKYQEARAAKFAARAAPESDDEKRATFLGLLDEEFTVSQKDSILRAMKYWLEG